MPVAVNCTGSEEVPSESDPTSMETPGAGEITELGGKLSRTGAGILNRPALTGA